MECENIFSPGTTTSIRFLEGKKESILGKPLFFFNSSHHPPRTPLSSGLAWKLDNEGKMLGASSRRKKKFLPDFFFVALLRRQQNEPTFQEFSFLL
jgi:hypothetical protein